MSHHPEYAQARRNGYDEQLDNLRPQSGRNLYHEMAGRNSASIQSKGVLEDLAQSTAAETAYLRTLTGLIDANNAARAELANVIVPQRPQIESDPLPRCLNSEAPPYEPRRMTREVADQIAAAANNQTPRPRRLP